jgi:membrane-bound serine protease (ClpP class)
MSNPCLLLAMLDDAASKGIAAFLLLALALILVVMEFLIPSMGLIVLTSVALAAGGAYLAGEAGSHWFLYYMIVMAIGVPCMIVLGIRLMKRSTLTIQGVNIPGGLPTSGAETGKPASPLPAAGAAGAAETVLRPAGKARIDGRPVDVVAEGDFIEKGVAVRVVRVEGNTVYVRASGR